MLLTFAFNMKIILSLLFFFFSFSSTFAYMESEIVLSCDKIENNSNRSIYFSYPSSTQLIVLSSDYRIFTPLDTLVEFSIYDDDQEFIFYKSIDCTPPPPVDECTNYNGSTVSNNILYIDSDFQSLLCVNGAFQELSGSLSLQNGGQYDYLCGALYCSTTITDDRIDPVDIHGYFDSSIQYDAYTPQFVVTMHVTTGATILNPLSIQIWDFFTITSVVPLDDGDPRIVFTLQKTDPDSTLIDKCNAYSLNIPSGTLDGNDGVSTNSQDITGFFEITGCPNIPPVDTGSTNSGSWVPPSSSGSYIALYYVDPISGARYIDIGSLMYLLVFGCLAIIVTFLIFKILKSVVTGKRLF